MGGRTISLALHNSASCPTCPQLGDDCLKVGALRLHPCRQVDGVRVKAVLRAGTAQLCVMEKLLFIRRTNADRTIITIIILIGSLGTS